MAAIMANGLYGSAGCGRNVSHESESQPEEWAPATQVSASRNLAAICSAFSPP